ncbi:MAG: PilT/PilU family type 4a pilus ATPase [Pseudoalteromonas distincta]|jgi:twitching motility protein PilU|tara:strand:+ start:13736 stop:14902 length:1167 start_codon:yes stop_codon:yes gene_type:complete
MDVNDYLHRLAELKGSDLFLSVGAPATIKREGAFVKLGDEPLAKGAVKSMAYALMSAKQISEFERDLEMNLAVGLQGVGRFRANVYVQRGEVAMVIRYINHVIPNFNDLGLPPVLGKLVMLDRGLILVTGSTGSGKSTTLASMLDYRNSNRAGHIVCIEDPIEFLHQHKESIIDQREVGLDTHSFADALHNVLREAPNVIMIGEIRDRATMQHALHYSETGHLVLATMHATNTVQAVDRMANMFPEDSRQQVLGDIAANLAAIIGQRLATGINKPRLPVVEVMVRTPYIVNLIARDETQEIRAAMTRATDDNTLQTFDQHLFQLISEKAITLKEALRLADSRNDLMLRAKMETSSAPAAPAARPLSSQPQPTEKVVSSFDSDLTDDFK